MANEITTQQLFDKWKDMDDKLDKLNNKIDNVTKGDALNTQVTGSKNADHKWKNRFGWMKKQGILK